VKNARSRIYFVKLFFLEQHRFFGEKSVFNIPFHYMIQIDRAGTKSFYIAGLFSRKNIVFNIPPLLGSKYNLAEQKSTFESSCQKV